MENDPSKPPIRPDPESLFRYSLVSLVLNHEHRGLARPEAIETVASQRHIDLEGNDRTVSTRTLYRWLSDFEQGGPDALRPATRKGGPLALPEELLNFFRDQKQADPRTSVPELIRRARVTGQIVAGEKIDRTTVWRALRRMGVPTNRLKSPKVRDCRRFAYPHRLDMVLCDGKHFRAGVGRLKRVALFFLDDATRFGLEVVVGTSESAALFLRGLYLCILHYGLMIRLFVDNGSGFIALDAIAVARKLRVHLIHGSAGYPEGHGKIERFNRTCLEQLLRLLPGNPEIDPDVQALELRLRHFLHEIYNHTPHEALNEATPWERFHRDSRALRFHEHTEQLRQAFVLHESRRVSRDHIVQVDGIAYETPLGLRGQEVMLYRHLLEGTVSLLHEGHLVQLAGVDLQANARDRRARGQDEPPTPMPPASTAQIAFDQDYRPVVDAEGGLSRNPKSKTEEKDS
ncbi:MAG: helix-turn-helix domain-containing protein [Pseudomonadota bacterium]|nr:helix-turn-helix domain-containing protein [Pseudomonadota bacterium]